MDTTPKGIKMKDIDSQIKGRRIYLKSLPVAKSKQLNYYVERALNNTNMIVERALNNTNMIIPSFIWALMVSFYAKVYRH